MQKQQLQGAVRSGEEPFSSFGVAKQPLPGLPAVPGHTVQPTLTPPPHPAPGQERASAPPSGPWAACSGLVGRRPPAPKTWLEDASTFRIHLQIHSRPHPGAASSGVGGRGMGNKTPEGKSTYLRAGVGGWGGAECLPPCPTRRPKCGWGGGCSVADPLNPNWVNPGMDQTGTGSLSP